MKISKLLYLILIIPMLCVAQLPQSNYSWVKSNIINLLDSLQLRQSVGDKGFTINFGIVKGEQKGFITNLLLQYLNKNVGEQRDEKSWLIHIEQFRTDIVYEQSSYGFLNLGTNFLRINNIALTGWVENNLNQPVKSFDINKAFKEKFDGDDFGALEAGPYRFTIGRTKDLSFWTSTIEPVMVSATIGIVVYLFFSVRS